MTMVAVGGSIGTGLLLGSAAALEIAGPSVILSYVVAAFIAYTVAMALGELASMHPAAGSFGVYGELYLNQYLGFLCRAAYWAAIAFSIGAELVASATYMTLLVPRRTRRSLGHRILGLASSGQPAQRAFLRTLRVLVLHDQARHHRGLHPGRRGTALQRPRRPAIHGPGRILSQRSNRPAAGGVLGHLRLRRSRDARRHHRRIAFLERHSPRHSPHLLPARRSLPRRHHRPRRRHALEPHRRLREPVRQRAPPGQGSSRSLLHEFRSPHRRALRSQRQTLRRLPPAFFHGPHRMGSRAAWAN